MSADVIQHRLDEYEANLSPSQHDIIRSMADYAAMSMYECFIARPLRVTLCGPFGKVMP